MDTNFNYARVRLHESELMRAAAASRLPVRAKARPRLRVWRAMRG